MYKVFNNHPLPANKIMWLADTMNDFYFAKATFIDKMKHFRSYEHVKDEPEFDVSKKIQMATISSTVEYMCHQLELPVPDWVYDSKYRLDDPYTGVTNKEYSKFLMETSLPEFTRNNLFFGENCCDRY